MLELLELESFKSIGGVGGNCKSIGDINKLFEDIFSFNNYFFFDFSRVFSFNPSMIFTQFLVFYFTIKLFSSF